jgi:hypothetical protein
MGAEPLGYVPRVRARHPEVPLPDPVLPALLSLTVAVLVLAERVQAGDEDAAREAAVLAGLLGAGPLDVPQCHKSRAGMCSSDAINSEFLDLLEVADGGLRLVAEVAVGGDAAHAPYP